MRNVHRNKFIRRESDIAIQRVTGGLLPCLKGRLLLQMWEKDGSNIHRRAASLSHKTKSLTLGDGGRSKGISMFSDSFILNYLSLCVLKYVTC